MIRQCYDMNCRARPKSRTKFSPWFGLLHVNFGCFINYDIHELVKALQMNEGLISIFVPHSRIKHRKRGRQRVQTWARTRITFFRFTDHPGTTGVMRSNSSVGCGLEIHAQLSVLRCAFLYCRTTKSRLLPSVNINGDINKHVLDGLHAITEAPVGDF